MLSVFFTSSLLKIQPTECLVCREIKANMMHLSVGSLFPTVFAWFVSFNHAALYNTYAMPNAENLSNPINRKRFLQHFKLIWTRTNKGAFARLMPNYLVQLFLCSGLLFMQQKQFKDTIESIRFTQAEINEVKNFVK